MGSEENYSVISSGVIVVLMLACMLSYALCILALNAIARSRNSRLRQLSKEGYVFARHARLVLSRSNYHFVNCHIAAFVSALLAGIALNELITRIVTDELIRALPIDEFLSFCILASVLVVVIAVISLALVQVAKSVAFSYPTRTLCLVSPLILVLSRILAPLTAILNFILAPILRALDLGTPRERELVVSAEEISEMVEISSKAGEIEDDEREMIQHVFTFSDTIVREVMTPRKEIIWVEEHAPLNEILKLFVSERLSRIVVCGQQLDDVKGILMAKDLLPLLLAEKNAESGEASFHMKDMMRPVHFVANSKKIDDLLQEFKVQAIHFAVVLDEHGGVDGVVTIEDLVEEIVGEIFDEYDSPADEMDVRRTQGGDLLVDGGILIHDLNAQFNLDIPEGEYDTFAGFVIHQLGHIPQSGDTLEYESLRIRVEELEESRITKLRIISKKKESKLKQLASKTLSQENNIDNSQSSPFRIPVVPSDI